MMYDELIKRLRYLAKVYSICDNENTNEYRLAIEAADAIEELQKRVPKTPHGRLIDADALMKQCKMGGDCNTCEHSSYGLWCDKGSEFVNVCEAISDAPTIIEAEENDG